jgi:homogentisate 1,2-dioxygenase
MRFPRVCVIFLTKLAAYQLQRQPRLAKVFIKNVYAHEMIFVHEGSGKLKTDFGIIEFGEGDYLVIPKGVIYQIDVASPNNRMFVVECTTAFEIPKIFRNEYGQCAEHAPYCERISVHRVDLRRSIKKVNSIFM